MILVYIMYESDVHPLSLRKIFALPKAHIESEQLKSEGNFEFWGN